MYIEDHTQDDREEWVENYRRVVEYFENTRDWDQFESGGAYPIESDPYVLHESFRYPLHEDTDKEFSWHILFNPWSGREREAWKMDGEPLLPSETVHGADDPENDLIASDEDIIRIGPGCVYVCVALTKLVQMHSRNETWVQDDDRVKDQFERIMEMEF